MVLRKCVIGMAMLSLAACGAQGDFALTADVPISSVKSELQRLQPNAMLGALGLRRIESAWPDPRTLRYTLPAESGKDPGILIFRLTEKGPAETVIDVELTIPEVIREIDGHQQILAESKMEKQLQDDLRKWREAMEQGQSTQNARDKVGTLLSVFAFGLQNVSEEQLAKKAAFNGPAPGPGEVSGGWGSEPDGGWGSESEAEGGGWGD
jgi:hypothetical protein